MYDGKVYLKDTSICIPFDRVYYDCVDCKYFIFIPRDLLNNFNETPSKICYKWKNTISNITETHISCFFNYIETRFDSDEYIIFVFRHHIYYNDYPSWVFCWERDKNLSKVLESK